MGVWNSADKLSRLITAANWGIAFTVLVTFALTVLLIKANSRRDVLIKIEDDERTKILADTRLRLEQYVSARTITDEQADIIKSALASARGQSITVFTLAGETEISNFANTLVSVLQDAGLMVGNRYGRLVGEPLPVGMALSFGTNREPLANLLHAAFGRAGLSIEPLPAKREPDANALIITVGPKN
jgi:hypothetical protein